MKKKLYEDFGASKLQNKLQQNRLYILWNTLCIGSNITIIFVPCFTFHTCCHIVFPCLNRYKYFRTSCLGLIIVTSLIFRWVNALELRLFVLTHRSDVWISVLQKVAVGPYGRQRYIYRTVAAATKMQGIKSHRLIVHPQYCSLGMHWLSLLLKRINLHRSMEK